MAAQLGCLPEQLADKIDLLMRAPAYHGLQRQNVLGTAFVGLLKYILEEFGSRHISYETEIDAATIFPRIEIPGRSGTPRIDLLGRCNGIPSVVVSAKWSIRHDRLADITNECPVYRAAYNRIYRQTRRSDLRYYVVTNEFDPARLNKILDDTCIDGVVHVHKRAVVDVCGLDGRLARMLDLTDMITHTCSW